MTGKLLKIMSYFLLHGVVFIVYSNLPALSSLLPSAIIIYHYSSIAKCGGKKLQEELFLPPSKSQPLDKPQKQIKR